MMRVVVRYDYPEWWDDEECRQYRFHSDWDVYEHEAVTRDLYLQNLGNDWLIGIDEFDCAAVRCELAALEPIPFVPKPARDKRQEKTRDYRKRRSRQPRYNAEIVPAISALICILGGRDNDTHMARGRRLASSVVCSTGCCDHL
jgi:hypothetical protein